METQALKQESPTWIKSGVDSSSTQHKPDQTKATDHGASAARNVDRVSLSGMAKSLQKADAQLSDDDLEFLTRLKARDQEVRAHEAAHLASAGGYATSGASYAYQEGPNGRQYAIGGEVGIDVSPVANDPAATITKADTIMKAALSPASPSPQDFKVADQARQMRMQASRDLAIKTQQEQQQVQEQSGKVELEEKQKAEAQSLVDEQQKAKEAEQKQADLRQEMMQKNDQTQTEQDTGSMKESETNDQISKQAFDRLASLNDLFSRYEEAREAYTAIVDFFTNQYVQNQKAGQVKKNTVEAFA